jgi:MFS family permease
VTDNHLPGPDNNTPRFFYGYIVVIAACLITVVSWAAYNSFGIFFNPLIAEFNWNRAITSGAFSLSMFIFGILGIIVGALNDRFGPRIVLTCCGIVLGLGYLLMSQVNSIWQLYLFIGFMVGTGMSGIWVPLLSSVARWFVKRRTLMTGIVIAGVGIGGLIGPPIVSRLIAAYDWRQSYIILGIAVLLLIVAFTQLIRNTPGQIRELPEKDDGEESRRMVESASHSFTFKEAVKTRQFWTVFCLLFCCGFGSFSALVHIVPHAIDLNISPTSAANILAVSGATCIAGNSMLGALGDRIGNRQIFIIGCAFFSAALFLLSVADVKWMLYIFIVIFGIAMGGTGASESPLTAWLFGTGSLGSIYGVIHAGFSTGAAVGPFITGYIYDLTNSYRLAFIISAILSAIGLVLAITLRPTKRPESVTAAGLEPAGVSR